MSVQLLTEGDEVTGEVALEIKPGSSAAALEALLDRVLVDPLTEAADALGAVLAAAPHRFAKPLPGKDPDGRLRYEVRARREGDRLLPGHGVSKLRRRG